MIEGEGHVAVEMTNKVVHNQTMTQVNIAEAKEKFSELVDRASRGERIVISRRNRPVAELGPVPRRPTRQRPFGLAKGRLRVASDFDAPLPRGEIDAWYGGE